MRPYVSAFSKKTKFRENQFSSEGVPFTVIFLEILSQVRIYHWQSFGYAEHTALGSYYDTMSGLIDGFVESYQGQFGRVFVDVSKVELEDMKEYSIINYINDTARWLREFKRKLNDSDAYNTNALQNMLDEMVGETDKLKYLLTLN